MRNSDGQGKTIIVIVILLTSGLLLWQFRPSSEPIGEDETPSSDSGARAPGPAAAEPFDLPVVAADMGWSEVDEAELQALVRQLEGWEEGEPFAATIGLGETLVTEGFEKAPGVFVFATLTPERFVGKETQPEMPEGVAPGDEEIYLVSVRQFEIDVSGGESILSAPKVLVKAGHEAAIQYSTGTLTGDGEFRGSTTTLEFVAEREGDSAVHLSGFHSVVEE